MSHLIDLYMSIHPFLLTWGVFFGAGIVFVSYQSIKNREDFSPLGVIREIIPFDLFRSSSVRMDLICYVSKKFTDFIFGFFGALIMAFVTNEVSKCLQFSFGSHSKIAIDTFTTVACTVVMIIAVEFSEYVAHYFEHKIPFLWELHKLHHSADHMTPLTTKREHSLLQLFNGLTGGIIRGVPAGIIMFLFGLGLTDTVALGIVANRILLVWTLDPLKHSHIPLGLGWFDRVFISPHMHQIHHSKVQAHWDRNFGTNLSIFDWMFGTGYKPKKGERAVFGISGYSDASLQKFNTLHGAFIAPVKRSYKRIVKSVRGSASPAANTQIAQES